MTRFPLAAALTLGLALTAHAHFIWLELPPGDGDVAHMRFAEAPLEATASWLQKLAAPMNVRQADGSPVTFEAGDEKRVATVNAATDLLLGHLDYGVMDRSDSGRGVYLLKYDAKGARDLEAAATVADLNVDIRATVAEGTLRVGVFFQGKPAPGAELALDLPAALEQVEGETDEQGFATFPVEPGGWVGIRAMVSEGAAGIHDGTPYAQVRHYGTLTFPFSTP